MGTAVSCGAAGEAKPLAPSPSHAPFDLPQARCRSPLQSPGSPVASPQYTGVHIDRMDGVWRERMLEAANGDVLAVTRDFPRIPVYVATTTHHNYCGEDGTGDGANNSSTTTNNNNSGGGGGGRIQDVVRAQAGQYETKMKQNDEVELLVMRNQRVRSAVELLMELCGEDTTAMHTAWSTHATSVDTADASALMLAALLQSGMLRAGIAEVGKTTPTQTETETETTTGMDLTREVKNPLSYGTDDAVTRSSPTYIVQSKALRLMQYMVQSVVFCSIQWITEGLRFPWCKHIQDVAWTVHVFLEKRTVISAANGNCNSDNDDAEGTEFIVLQHKQILRHYVEPRELRRKPRFEINWTCSIVLSPKYLLCGDSAKEVYDVRTEVLGARVERPKRMCCLTSALWRRRRRELAERLKTHFGIPLDEVPTLMQCRPDGRN